MTLAEKVALVTGAGSGVGRGIALAMGAAGARIALNYPPGDQAGAEETARLLQGQGTPCLLVEADVSDREQVQAMVERIDADWARLDVLVNNAAVQLNRSLLEYAPADLDWVIDVNVGGYFWCTQAVLPLMKAQGGGRIIHIASVHAKRPSDFDPVYAMTKASVIMLTRESALALGPYHITVNAITPGAIQIEQPKFALRVRPDLVRPSVTSRVEPRRVNRMILGRAGQPRDVGDLAVFLASEGSQWMTGSVLRLDGGSMLG